MEKGKTNSDIKEAIRMFPVPPTLDKGSKKEAASVRSLRLTILFAYSHSNVL